MRAERRFQFFVFTLLLLVGGELFSQSYVQSPQVFPVRSYHYQPLTADFNGDGFEDLYFVTGTGLDSAVIMFNDMSGNFLTPFYVGSNETHFLSLAVDIDGDSDVDIIELNDDGPNKVFKNNGSGSFTFAQDFGPTSGWVGQGLTRDFNGDGYPDVAFPISSVGLYIFTSDSMGVLTQHQFVANSNIAYGLTGNDFDGNQSVDIYCANNGPSGTYSHIYINNGNGIFSPTSGISSSLPFEGYYAKSYDYDGDLDMDVITTGPGIVIWENNGSGVFTADLSLNNIWPQGGRGFDVGDIDQDGDMDILTFDYDDSLVMYKNNGMGSFTPETDLAPVEAKVTNDIKLLDLNGDGYLDFVHPGTIAPGVFPPTADKSPLIMYYQRCKPTDPSIAPEICVISVDSTSTFNRIVWEKQNSPLLDSIFIYRDIVGTYQKVGAVGQEDLSEFVDSASNANPSLTSYRYKIEALDTCGSLFGLSDFHETMHLTINQGINNEINLIWDSYQGFAYPYYRIWRTNPANNNEWEVIDSVSNASNTYTDLTPPSGGALSYRIEVVSPYPCTSTESINTYTSTLSNTKSTATIGVTEYGAEGRYVLFPNPSSGMVQLKGPLKGAEVAIYDGSGKLISERNNCTSNELFWQSLDSGFYTVRIIKNDEVSSLKLVVL